MDVITLGTGSPMPDPNRAGPCSLVRAAGATLLVDAGRGVLMRAAAVGVLPPMLSAVLLTHLHSDHVTDLNDVITSRWVMSMEPAPLPVVGPPGTAELVARTLEMLRPDVGWRLAHHEDLTWEPEVVVTEVADGPVELDLPGVTVTAAPTEHRPVHPTVGYRIEADGAAVALAGDTVPCEGLDRICAGAQVYVQTAIRRSVVEALPIARLQDILDYHSSVEDAAATAARAGVRTLVLTHMVPGLPPEEAFEQPWIDDARPHFDGEVVVARDLTTITA